VHVWQSYLWAGRINSEFLYAVKASWIDCYSRFDCFTKSRSEENLCKLLAIVMLDFPDLLSDEEIKKLFYNLPERGLPHVIEYFKDRLMTVDDPPSYYAKTIHSIIISYWPKDVSKQSSDTSFQIALLAIATKKGFPKALETLSDYIIKTEEISHMAYRIKETNLPVDFPEGVLCLLYKTVSENTLWGFDLVREALNRCTQTKPDIKNSSKYKQLNEILMRKGV